MMDRASTALQVRERNRDSRRPKLLVSVRSLTEAGKAVRGGVDIIDVKEPRRGPLGMAAPAVIGDVAEFVQESAPGLSISAALGELKDWDQRAAGVHRPVGLTFAKMGLAGMASSSDWPDRWRIARAGIEQQWECTLDWVAVAYADAQRAEAPLVEEIIAEARADCTGLLIDTWCKESGSLLNIACVNQLAEWVQTARQARLFVALAGRVRAGDLRELAHVSADVIAVRSAVCPAQQRDAEISFELITGFRQQLSIVETRRDPDPFG